MSFIFFFAPRYISFVLLGCSRNILWALKVHSPFHRHGCESDSVDVVGISAPISGHILYTLKMIRKLYKCKKASRSFPFLLRRLSKDFNAPLTFPRAKQVHSGPVLQGRTSLHTAFSHAQDYWDSFKDKQTSQNVFPPNHKGQLVQLDHSLRSGYARQRRSCLNFSIFGWTVPF